MVDVYWANPPFNAFTIANRVMLQIGYALVPQLNSCENVNGCRHFYFMSIYENQVKFGSAIFDALKDGLAKRDDLSVTFKPSALMVLRNE